jgi:hypothetical protein
MIYYTPIEQAITQKSFPSMKYCVGKKLKIESFIKTVGEIKGHIPQQCLIFLP